MTSFWRWGHRNLFGSWLDGLITLAVLGVAAMVLPGLIRWTLIDATWQAPDSRACHVDGAGACWAFLAAKLRFLLFGRYPYALQWRPGLATALLVAMMAVSAMPSLTARLGMRRIAWLWLLAVLASLILMQGVGGPLAVVDSDLWGGLPVTLLLSLFSMALALPLALVLALGRLSPWPLPRILATAIVEGVRGVPLVSILFMAVLMLPFFLPDRLVPPKFWATMLGFALFLASYWAEDIRAGLMAVPRGQREAADALGLSSWQKLRLVVLPQALGLVIAPMVGNAIGNFKNTSVVVVVGLFDLMLTAQNALLDPAWAGPVAEAYLFLGALYLLVCLAMAHYGHLIERAVAKRGKDP